MRVIDCHAHLEEVPNLDQELKIAKENGVAAVIAVGADEDSNKAVQDISQRYPNYVLPALGLHPWNLRENIERAIRSIEENIERCIALGEVGLDFRYQTPKELQIKAFSQILDLAAHYDKPVIIHSRWAWREAFEMVDRAGIDRAVFHWYSGPLDVLQKIIARGYYVSATPAAEFSEAHRTAIKAVPLEQLLLETDSPVKYRGVAATPSHIIKTLKAVAQLKEVEEAELSEKTTENASRIFGIKI
ncbi:MAG: TatD family hydrolase [Candidatus Hadarchaeum sp.]|uniref:TatD family hydrolase n=1 Tax=Candidatus Hadarchaeum sp. TaxID=2883567 RepID=UPI003D118E59